MQAINVVPGVPKTAAVVSYAGFVDIDPAFAEEHYLISGTTRDSTGAALGSCTVKCYRTTDDVEVLQTLSATDGTFSFYVARSLQFYLVAYLAGSPDVVGTTVNTITGTQV